MKDRITRAELREVERLVAVAEEHFKAIERVENAIAGIIGEDDAPDLACTLAAGEADDVKEFLEDYGIAVEEDE